MNKNEEKLRVIAEDCKAVIEEAKSMGCNKVRALYNIPLENMELIVQALEKQISKKSILMGDLISRSELLKQLEIKPKNSTVPKEVKLKDLITYYHEKVIEVIEDMPTAYDVDKVVEGLEATKETAFELLKIPKFLKKDLQELVNMCFDEAIEIVKQGGVSDDVCEYRITDKVVYASCNNKQIASAFCWFDECGDYKYCPYCGKRIKVVE